MTPHTTHFDDCGCLAEQHAVEMAVKRVQIETQKANVQAYRLEAQEAQAENAALRRDIERLRAFATGFCSRHAVPDATCDICNPVVHALRAEVERLKEQKKYNADECVRLSNENGRLRDALEQYAPNHEALKEADDA